MSAETFAAELRGAEDRLRASGLAGRRAYAALCRHMAERLDLPEHLWLEGPDAPDSAHLERIPLTAELDLFGLAYERFFPEVFKAERGQFFTPQPLVELMVDLAGVRARDRVLDPTCGSGTFLAVAASRGSDVDGIEVDPELVALCRLNLVLHGVDPRAVRRADLFRDEPEDQWDVVLANPPFSVDITDPTTLERYSLAEGRSRVNSDVLFLEAATRRLRPGGRLAVVLPHSVLANARYADARSWLEFRYVRRAVVELPEGMFRPFGGTSARACVVVLQKRPAALAPWSVASVDNPGFDPTRRSYHRTEPDELALVRIQHRDGLLPTAPVEAESWQPAHYLSTSGIGPSVPTRRVETLVRVETGTVRPRDEPDRLFTEIDLADIDKQTGEVTSARVLSGSAFKGAKAAFSDGDLVFARMRPNLNNVALVRRPAEPMPTDLCGSTEWVRLIPQGQAHFTLLALRSSFVRAQLQATGGQTRPRIRASDLPDLLVPDPGAEARMRLDRLVEEAHRKRWEARQVLDGAAQLYEAYGRGDLGERELSEALDRLER
ncbi:MAG: N-6 DNA methylase [Myxococcota bacterium]|jgi:methylase of polypeptide subunit release factors|nr:N-6 DNA methylase [Myxococcota bacterium]